MAKNKGLKWLVGLSSVIVFAGCIGLVEKFDQARASATGGTDSVTGSTTQNSQDSSTPFFSNGGSDDNADTPQQPLIRVLCIATAAVTLLALACRLAVRAPKQTRARN